MRQQITILIIDKEIFVVRLVLSRDRAGGGDGNGDDDKPICLANFDKYSQILVNIREL